MLAARDEAHLAAEAARLEAAGVPVVRVHEDDAPFCGALMALGLPPARKEKRKRLLSSMPLLR